MSKQRRLTSIRIELPKGLYYDVLTAGAKLHGAPSISKYVLNAAMTYTQDYLEKKKEELDERKEEGRRLRDTEGNGDRDDSPEPGQDPGTGGGSGSIPSTGESGD